MAGLPGGWQETRLSRVRLRAVARPQVVELRRRAAGDAAKPYSAMSATIQMIPMGNKQLDDGGHGEHAATAQQAAHSGAAA